MVALLFCLLAYSCGEKMMVIGYMSFLNMTLSKSVSFIQKRLYLKLSAATGIAKHKV
jgi:hypothetical protein